MQLHSFFTCLTYLFTLRICAPHQWYDGSKIYGSSDGSIVRIRTDDAKRHGSFESTNEARRASRWHVESKEPRGPSGIKT